MLAATEAESVLRTMIVAMGGFATVAALAGASGLGGVCMIQPNNTGDVTIHAAGGVSLALVILDGVTFSLGAV